MLSCCPKVWDACAVVGLVSHGGLWPAAEGGSLGPPLVATDGVASYSRFVTGGLQVLRHLVLPYSGCLDRASPFGPECCVRRVWNRAQAAILGSAGSALSSTRLRDSLHQLVDVECCAVFGGLAKAV